MVRSGSSVDRLRLAADVADVVPPRAPGSEPSVLPVEQIGPDLHRHVARVLAECFDVPLDGSLHRWCAEAMAAPGRITYAAFEGWTVVAVASLLVDGETALLSGAATLPQARGRGIYVDLLARRLEDAARLGVNRVIVEVELGSDPAGLAVVRVLRGLGFTEVAAGPGPEPAPGDPGIGPIQPQ